MSFHFEFEQLSVSRKTSRFSDVFRGYRNLTLQTNFLERNEIKCSSVYDQQHLLGIINLVRLQNFSKKQYFLPPDTHTHECV